MDKIFGETQELHQCNVKIKLLEAIIEEQRRQIQALLDHCDKEGGECSDCSKIICPSEDEMHFHHDGCPSCTTLD